MEKKMEQDLERAMASLDNIVDSALKEAGNVKELLATSGDISTTMDSNSAQVNADTQSSTSVKLASAQSEAINSSLNDDEKLSGKEHKNSHNFYTAGSIIVEMYDCNHKVPGWHPFCKIVTDQIISDVILDLDNDLIAFNSNNQEIKIGRISNPGTFLSVNIHGQKYISLMSFAKLFLSNGEISPFIIFITTDGTVSATSLDVSDPIEIFLGLNGN